MKELGATRHVSEAYPFFENSDTWQVISGRRYPLRPHVLLDPEQCRVMAGLLRGAGDKKAGKKLRRKLAALAFAMALSIVIPGYVNTAKAATYTATCIGTAGNVSSLITAINSANTNPGPDTVNVGGPGCIYNLTTVNNWWYGPNGLPAIASDITIEGNGSTIQRGAAAPKLRFFYVGADPVGNPLSLGFNTPGAGKLTLHNMTLKDGWQQGSIGGSGGAGMGGAIFNQGKVVLGGVTFTGNYAQGGVGGYGSEGGGMGGPGGFGGSVTPAGSSGYNGYGNFGMSWNGGGLPAGGGGGFGASDNATGYSGGGTQNGLGGNGGGNTSWPSGAGGNGSGGGNYWSGGGGVGGGGSYGYGGGGGGGFGGGGGCTGGGWGVPAGNGGFGGGGGCGGFLGGVGGNAGFGGGNGGDTYGGGGAGMGGAIFNHVGDVTISNSTLSSNTATGGSSPGNGGSGFGAALFNLNGTVKITGSTITSNTVSAGSGSTGNGSAGGAIYNLGYDGNLSPHATVTISSDTVISGTTGGNDKVNNAPALVSGGLTNKATASIIVPPKAPSGIFAKAVSPSKIDLSWKDNSSNETGFKIERRAGNCDPGNINPWAQIAAKGANIVFFENSGLTASTAYSYRVRSYNLAGNSSYTSCTSATTGKAGTPNSPSGLTTVSATTGKINLSWKDNSSNETGFKIYRKTGAGAWTLLTLTPLPSGVLAYGDSTAAGNDASNSYSYYIQACNVTGCSSPTYAATVPFRPTGVAATPSAGNIELTWTDNSSNEAGFQVYKKAGTCLGAGTWALRAATASNAESYNDTAVTSGHRYSYKTRAYYRSSAQPYAKGYSMFTSCVEAIVP